MQPVFSHICGTRRVGVPSSVTLHGSEHLPGSCLSERVQTKLCTDLAFATLILLWASQRKEFSFMCEMCPLSFKDRTREQEIQVFFVRQKVPIDGHATNLHGLALRIPQHS
jgi:hypothetical protein